LELISSITLAGEVVGNLYGFFVHLKGNSYVSATAIMLTVKMSFFPEIIMNDTYFHMPMKKRQNHPRRRREKRSYGGRVGDRRGRLSDAFLSCNDSRVAYDVRPCPYAVLWWSLPGSMASISP